MTMNRRQFGIAATAASVAVLGGPAVAQGTGRPIRFIVGFGPGTGPDIIGRIVADHMGRELGQPVVVDNKPGGEGIIAADLAAKSPPDGSTIYFGSSHSLVATPILRGRPTVPYDPLKDFTPISELGLFTLAVVVGPAMPGNTLADFVAHARAHPREFNYASSSINNRLAAMQIVAQHRLELTHVPYKSEMLGLTDLMGGRIQLQVASVASGLAGFAKEGKLKVLAVQRGTRSPSLPDVPTTKEANADIRISPWSGLYAPAGLAPALADRYSQAYRAAVSGKEVRDRFDQLGFEPVPTTPQELAALHRTEYEVFRKIVVEDGVKFD